MWLTSSGEVKNLESSKVWFLELIHLELRPPRKDFDELGCVIYEYIVFSTESLVDDGSKT